VYEHFASPRKPIRSNSDFVDIALSCMSLRSHAVSSSISPDQTPDPCRDFGKRAPSSLIAVSACGLDWL
jgi:hypothetical protein